MGHVSQRRNVNAGVKPIVNSVQCKLCTSRCKEWQCLTTMHNVDAHDCGDAGAKGVVKKLSVSLKDALTKFKL
jgi:hypothetical protein